MSYPNMPNELSKQINTTHQNGNFHRVYLALGSNLGCPLVYINNAIDAIKAIERSELVAVSPFYRTKPFGGVSQNDYLNAVIALDTQLSPEALLDKTQKIELAQGRIRTEQRFASRTLDIDILLYDNLTLHDERLTIPHHGLLEREFMLYPLFDIAPNLILPNNMALIDVIHKIDKNGMTLWSEDIKYS